jgi:DNA polymerase III alpha subunit
VSVKTTKDGRQYSVLQVEDLTGNAEVQVSAKAFSAYQSVLVKDTAVLFRARISEPEEDLRISGLEFRRVQLSDEIGILRLQLRSEDMTQENVTILKLILQLYPGPSPVELVSGPGGKVFRLGPECNVSIEAAVGDIRSEFGRNVIVN